MAEIKNDYQSVCEHLPDNGQYYDVIVILHDYSIAGGYGYYKGLYNNETFFVDSGHYTKNNEFRCSWTQKEVIAWKFLEKCSLEQIKDFIKKVEEK